ncbi:hypothetical protein FKM82_011325 [Ascaphus truei]
MLPDQGERTVSLPDRWHRISKFVLSACAATVAELVTFPLDLTKTRLQIQGEAALSQQAGTGPAVPYRGMVRTAVGIVQEEGLIKLWQGATPAVLRHIVYSGGRMVVYEQLRDSSLGKGENEDFPLWKAVIGGMTAGAIGQFFASPTDLVKVQMQMEGKRRLEGKPPRICSGVVAAGLGTPADVIKTRIMNQPRDKHGRGILYKSSIDCFIQAVRGEGFMSLYKGFIPTWMRMAPWSLVFWLTYEQIRRLVGVRSF